MKNFLVFFFLLLTFNALALEIDEKLTVRIIGVSNSRKTILINRGVEDGLAVGDHAKFFVSVGVVSRGVVIKSSPTRSVWSLYRLVNKEFIRDEQVLKLKITPAVKITKDESKMLVKDDSRVQIAKDPRDLGIPLAEGADDLNRIEQRKGSNPSDFAFDVSQVNLNGRNREIFGMLSYSSLTENTSPDNNTEDYTQDITNLYLKFGGEWYFKSETEWYSRFSLLAHFAIDRKSVMAHQGTTAKEEGSEFGFGVTFHPKTMPSKIHKIIPYLNYTLALGSVSSTYISGDDSQDSAQSSADSSVFAHNVGFGAKYYTGQGIGARFELSYQLRGDASAEDSDGISWVKTRTGPRLLFGLSYRL